MDVEISDYVPPVKENPFTPIIQKLIDAGDGKQATLKGIPTGDVPKTRKKLREAANGLERTAKVQDVIDNGDGTSNVVITVGARQYRPGNGKPAETPAETDAAPAKGAKK